VRSEGGRIRCDFNGLRRWVKRLGAFQAQHHSAPLFWHLDRIRRAGFLTSAAELGSTFLRKMSACHANS
jgi:hypothetical protein